MLLDSLSNINHQQEVRSKKQGNEKFIRKSALDSMGKGAPCVTAAAAFASAE